MARPRTPNLLELALRRYGNGELAEAEQICLRLLHDDPNESTVWSLWGALALGKGALPSAVERFERAVALSPNQAVFHVNLGEAWRRRGDLCKALSHLQRAATLMPGLAEAHYNLGLLYVDLQRPREAAEALQRAIAIKPGIDRTAVYGDVLRQLGEFERSASYFQTALRSSGEIALVHASYGALLHELRRVPEAIQCYERALALDANCALAHANLGLALKHANRHDEGIQHLVRGLELDPQHLQAHANLASALLALGCVDEALVAIRRAVAVRPESAALHSNLLFALAYHPDIDAKTQCEEARAWSLRHAEPLTAERLFRVTDASPHRRLQIGYVSAEFRDHVEAHVMLPLLRHHDHYDFRIVCYSSVKRPTAETAQMRASADEWRDVFRLTDRETAELIANDQIDILVNLGMHQGENRTVMFAYRPAPIQVCWLAYPGTTGLSTMDYRLTDPYLDPPGTDLGVYSENSVFLPDSFWCYDPLVPEPEVNELPALQLGAVTFGSLNKPAKINARVLSLWARLLSLVPTARLLLVTPPGKRREFVLARMQENGVDAARIEFVHGLSRQQYRESYHRIDIGLDPFPYNGGITSLDAFWMGVPVITVLGATATGRSGNSIATNLGLPELVTRDPAEYLEVGRALAADLPRLAELRRNLRSTLERSPLMDGARFARGLEAAYRTMWTSWCTTMHLQIDLATPRRRGGSEERVERTRST